MNWEHLLEHYGYWAVFIGTIFEGETVLVLGAYAVNQYILKFWMLIVVATLGAFIGDQAYYLIGRHYGRQLINKKPILAQKFDQASQFIDRYPNITILVMRFAWGLRTVLPMSIGIRKYHLGKYMLMNLIASLIWALVIVCFGIKISEWLHLLFKKLLPYHHDFYIILSVVLVILLIAFIRYFYFKFKKKNPTV